MKFIQACVLSFVLCILAISTTSAQHTVFLPTIGVAQVEEYGESYIRVDLASFYSDYVEGNPNRREYLMEWRNSGTASGRITNAEMRFVVDDEVVAIEPGVIGDRSLPPGNSSLVYFQVEESLVLLADRIEVPEQSVTVINQDEPTITNIGWEWVDRQVSYSAIVCNTLNRETTVTVSASVYRLNGIAAALHILEPFGLSIGACISVFGIADLPTGATVGKVDVRGHYID